MKRRFSLVLLIWLAAFILIYALAPQPPRPAATSVGPGKWELPELRLSDPEAAKNELRARQIWGALPLPPGVQTSNKAEEIKPLTRPDWRILAAISSGGEQYIVIRVGDDPPVNIKAGERLPDGSLLSRVEPDRLFLVLRGKKRILRIYPE